MVVSGSDDGTVRVWDLATGTPVGDPFTGHTDRDARWQWGSWTAARWWSPAATTARCGCGTSRVSQCDVSCAPCAYDTRRPLRPLFFTVAVIRWLSSQAAATGPDGFGIFRPVAPSKTLASNGAAANSIAILGLDHAVWALGTTLIIGPIRQDSVNAVTIDLESEVLALAT